MKDIDKKSLTLKTINKSNVWDIQENDVFRMLEVAEKDSDIRENIKHYIDIIKSAFEVEEIKIDRPEIIKKYEARGFQIGTMPVDESQKVKIGIKKRPILRVRTSDIFLQQNCLKLSIVILAEVGILCHKAFRISYRADLT